MSLLEGDEMSLLEVKTIIVCDGCGLFGKDKFLPKDWIAVWGADNSAHPYQGRGFRFGVGKSRNYCDPCAQKMASVLLSSPSNGGA